MRLEEATPEEMIDTIITLGKPLVTLLANMDKGRCNNATAKAGVDLAIDSLRISIRALRGQK